MADSLDQDMNGSCQTSQENGSESQTEKVEEETATANGSTESHPTPPVRDDDRKLFVGGLSWETSDKELKEHFSQYGDIESIYVKTNPNTGRSRGFAFIEYKSADSIEKVMAAGDHVINNKKVDPKKAKARHGKIFVGGLTPDISDDEIKTFFGQFGNIVEVGMPFDKQKNRHKGFCFITFDSEQVVKELLKTPKQTISGKEVDVKKATPKPDRKGPMGSKGGRGGGMRPPRRATCERCGPGAPKGGGYGQGWGRQGYGGYGYGQGSYSGAYDDYGYGGYGPGGGGKGGYGGGKQRGGGGSRQPRHAPY